MVKLTTPRNFEARAEVDVDPDELPRGLLRWGGELDDGKLGDALHSDAVLRELIVRAFPMPRGPEAERRLVDRVRSRLVCNYTTRTRNTIDLRYYDRDPERAVEIVNRFARLVGEENIVPVAAPPVVQVKDQAGELWLRVARDKNGEPIERRLVGRVADIVEKVESGEAG